MDINLPLKIGAYHVTRITLLGMQMHSGWVIAMVCKLDDHTWVVSYTLLRCLMWAIAKQLATTSFASCRNHACELNVTLPSTYLYAMPLSTSHVNQPGMLSRIGEVHLNSMDSGDAGLSSTHRSGWVGTITRSAKFKANTILISVTLSQQICK